MADDRAAERPAAVGKDLRSGCRALVVLIVVGNTGDPATAYRSSVRIARLLASARLLTVRGFGHTALLNPSRCVDRREVAYFLTGALPPTDIVCHHDSAPFAPAG